MQSFLIFLCGSWVSLCPYAKEYIRVFCRACLLLESWCHWVSCTLSPDYRNSWFNLPSCLSCKAVLNLVWIQIILLCTQGFLFPLQVFVVVIFVFFLFLDLAECMEKQNCASESLFCWIESFPFFLHCGATDSLLLFPQSSVLPRKQNHKGRFSITASWDFTM